MPPVNDPERIPIPCPVCEMFVNVGLMSKNDKIMVTVDAVGNFAGAYAVHDQCVEKFKELKL